MTKDANNLHPDWISLSRESVRRSMAQLSPEIIDAVRRSGTKDTINRDR